MCERLLPETAGEEDNYGMCPAGPVVCEQKLCQERYRLDIRKVFIPGKAIKH